MRKAVITLFVFLLVIPLSIALDRIIVNEGELIRLNVDATDPDGDELEYTFPEPFDQYGLWQTDYNDSGEYLVKLAVSDGEYITYEEIILKINDVDRAPEFKGLKESYTIKEEGELEIELEATDPDGDAITFEAVNLPEGAEFEDGTFKYRSDYDTVIWEDTLQTTIIKKLCLDRIFRPRRQTFKVRFIAKGSEVETANDVMVKIQNINRRPVLEEVEDLVVYETEEILLQPSATDPDGDRISFSYSGSMNSNSYITKYDDEGDYEVKIIASDGDLSDSQIVHITIKNSNREPELDEIDPVVVNENQSFSIELIASDIDNDELSYSVEDMPEGAILADNIFTWTPDFDSAGQHIITFVAEDANKGEAKQQAVIDIIDINRRPVIASSSPGDIQVYAEEPVKFTVEAVDLDGDNLIYVWSFGAFESYEGNYTEHLRTFTSPGTKNIKVIVSDGEFSVKEKWKIEVV